MGLEPNWPPRGSTLMSYLGELRQDEGVPRSEHKLRLRCVLPRDILGSCCLAQSKG